MPAHANETLMRDGYSAFGRGDMEALRGMFDPQVVWHIPGHSPVSGTYKGIDEVFALFGRLFTETGGTIWNELHDVVANDEHAVALVRQTAERAGKKLDTRLVNIQHIREGKVTESWYFTEDERTVEDFWS
jgi:ketosteroid isomerase-like protein